MNKKIIFTAAVALFLAIVPAAFAAIEVITYPHDVVDVNMGTVTITWDDGSGGPVADAVFLYGTSTMSYPVTIAAGTTGNLSFIPKDIGMTGGVYYFRVSNAADASWSNEYRLFIGTAEALGVNLIELAPNPFSPDLGGLNIKYSPQAPDKISAKITIKAYTMAGKLVRTIVPTAMRTVKSLASDVWDGKDDRGYMCKNGRYIIQIEIEDLTLKKQYLNSVILVK